MRAVKVIEATDREQFEKKLNDFLGQGDMLLFNNSISYADGKYISVICYEKVPTPKRVKRIIGGEICAICGNMLPTESGLQYCKECEEKYL